MIKPEDEAELRVMAKQLYKNGGIANVLVVVQEMGETMEIILDAAAQLMKEEAQKNHDNL